jgi:hypothetical protein
MVNSGLRSFLHRMIAVVGKETFCWYMTWKAHYVFTNISDSTPLRLILILSSLQVELCVCSLHQWLCSLHGGTSNNPSKLFHKYLFFSMWSVYSMLLSFPFRNWELSRIFSYKLAVLTGVSWFSLSPSTPRSVCNRPRLRLIVLLLLLHFTDAV